MDENETLKNVPDPETDSHIADDFKIKNENNIENAPAPKTLFQPFSASDWLTLGTGIILALLWLHIFGLKNLLLYQITPRLGVTVYIFALLAAVFAKLKRDVIINRDTIFLTVGTLLLALNFSLIQCDNLWFLNLLLLFSLTSVTIFALSGKAHRSWRDAGIIPESLRLLFTSLFVNFAKPFRAFSHLFRGDRKKLWEIGLGVLCAAVLLALIIPLLSSADAVFADIFDKLSLIFTKLALKTLIWDIIKTVFVSLMIFSLLYFLSGPSKEKAQKKTATRRALPASPFVTMLFIINSVYIVFAAIQIAFLFGGAETAAMHGGYAEYARNGFFQLVAVAAINLAVVLITASANPDGKAAKILSLVLIALTVLILVSAFWRMRLYILAYGLSLLRAMTLLGIIFIAICLAAASYKAIKPGFRFWPVFFSVGMSLWLLFNYINIPSRIADYNVNAYLNGSLKSVDVYYLAHLSRSTLPALERLRVNTGGDYQSGGESTLDDVILHIKNGNTDPYTPWQAWSLDKVFVSW